MESPSLANFFTSEFTDEFGCTLLAGFRVPEELDANVFVFSMRDWESTKLVLMAREKCKVEICSEYSQLSPIELPLCAPYNNHVVFCFCFYFFYFLTCTTTCSRTVISCK